MAIKKIFFKCFLITTCEVGPEVIIIISILQTTKATKTQGKLQCPRPPWENITTPSFLLPVLLLQ